MSLGNLSFRFSWRAYQARILERLEQYRDDRKVHIVAPPGAGKTVLGLEIVRRIGKRTLILAPSLTIREQWAERLATDFGGDPNLVSFDLDAPGAFTIVTYQALFAYHERAGTDGLDWVATLVVDECHHLRREWWRVLDAVAARYRPELVALTATPPYDVSGVEWRRYHDFCGEIDEEISIPELVASGDLCPHQDYLYPILPPPGEARLVDEWQQRKDDLLQLAHTRSELAYRLRDHPWLREPEAHYAAIFERPEYFTALLSVLRAQGSTPPAAALGVLHGEATLAPPLDDYWLGVFLQGALRSDDFFADGPARVLLQPYRRALSAMGAWDRGKLRLDEPLPPATGAAADELESPRSQLEATVRIADLESDSLLDNLRMVILTDNIHDEFLPTTEHDRRPLLKMGTVPVFEALRREGDAYYRDHLCVLTGSLVILPAAAVDRLVQLAYAELPATTVVGRRPLFPGSDFTVVDVSGLANARTVAWITQLFTEGAVRIIVGTKSLLGEGWDAPVVNSLVLANRVGSFVLSNQMRGRAIRTVPGQPDKTANIWHPVVVHPDVRRGGPQVDRMRRRFRGFAGPRLTGAPAIQNGIERFDLTVTTAAAPKPEKSGDAPPALPASGQRFRTTDADSLLELRDLAEQRATSRDELADRWRTALASGRQLVEAIRPPAERYYERKDPLTLHYRESVDRHVEERYRLVLVQMKVANMLALALGICAGALLPASLLATGVVAGLALAGAAFVIPRFLRLRRETAPLLQRHDRHPAFGKELNLWPHVVYPVVFSLLLAGLHVTAVVGFWAVYFSWLLMTTAFRPEAKRNEAARRHTLLADTSHRLLAYGRALAQTLGAGHFHTADPDQLRLEETDGEQLVYLAGAEHHDNQLFSGALSELMSPVDNPRYLLRLKLPDDWSRGEYYLGVPTALGNRRDADRLAELLSAAVEQDFEAIYTREPAGRLHLLTARLQASSKAEAELARREQLWR
ncbi:DEAD/DEAH box helicase family protein [Lewinella sp. IMCC34183]|uniref:DEAD/DEAH box helicase family protein n=1 Tax=Lewinella sp. IMCC34183 TaxID=2248762 RepID=UPI0018E5311D|nr:DEAD/DEAH box helicase family protein [Lewinella sp. IMCC34183]